MSNDIATLIAQHIDEGYDMLVAGTLIAGQTGISPVYADDWTLEEAADTAVALRAKVRDASRRMANA